MGSSTRVADQRKRVCEIGCGIRKVFEVSIGVDVRRLAGVDIVADARALPFKDESFDRVYSSHVFEHFSHREARMVLAEWVRVLKPSGEFELRCPDLRARALLFFLKPNWKNVARVYGEQDHAYNFHKSGYSSGLMRNLLESVGIRDVRRILDGYKGIPFLPADLHVRGIKQAAGAPTKPENRS